MDDPSTAYVDEEDCLGFKIWVAELELVVGGSRGKRKADVAQSYHLLQKLVVTIDRTDRAEVREYQRRCEDALIDILLKGAPPPVSFHAQIVPNPGRAAALLPAIPVLPQPPPCCRRRLSPKSFYLQSLFHCRFGGSSAML